MQGITGKSIIVTGGADGIGAAAARLFARNGAFVTIADINQAGGNAVAKDIENDGGRAIFVQTDIAREDDVIRLVDAAVTHFDRLDGAFNNAAIPNLGRPVHEVTFAEWQRCISINLSGTFLCMKYEIQAMLKTGGGAIVNTSSTAGLVTVPVTAEYTASKHGVSGLTKAAASDYGHHNIRVNAIAPAAVKTTMYANFVTTNPEFEANLVALHPIGRASEPIEQASAAQFLLSDAASFITGIIMPVDGGYTAV